MAKKKSTRNVNKAVKVLQDSVTHWSEYAVNTARLASSGDLNPGAWAQEYAKMWQGLAEDLGAFMKLMFPQKR
jgi:hypothetical protein